MPNILTSWLSKRETKEHGAVLRDGSGTVGKCVCSKEWVLKSGFQFQIFKPFKSRILVTCTRPPSSQSKWCTFISSSHPLSFLFSLSLSFSLFYFSVSLFPVFFSFTVQCAGEGCQWLNCLLQGLGMRQHVSPTISKVSPFHPAPSIITESQDGC